MISRQQSSCSSFLIKRNSTPAASISQTTLEANSDTNSSHVEQEVVQTVTFHASKFSWGLTGWNGESGWQWLSPGISQDASGADYRHCHRSILKVSTTMRLLWIPEYWCWYWSWCCWYVQHGERQAWGYSLSAGFTDHQAPCLRNVQKCSRFLDYSMMRSDIFCNNHKT